MKRLYVWCIVSILAFSALPLGANEYREHIVGTWVILRIVNRGTVTEIDETTHTLWQFNDDGTGILEMDQNGEIMKQAFVWRLEEDKLVIRGKDEDEDSEREVPFTLYEDKMILIISPMDSAFLERKADVQDGMERDPGSWID